MSEVIERKYEVYDRKQFDKPKVKITEDMMLEFARRGGEIKKFKLGESAYPENKSKHSWRNR